MLEELNLFPIKVYRTNLVLDNDAMRTKLYELKNANNHDLSWHSSPWQSSRDLHILMEFKNLCDRIGEIIRDIFKKESQILQMWGSVYAQYDFNNLHNHPPLNGSYTDNPLWAGVYYLDTSKNSAGLNIHSHVNLTDTQIFYPIPGDLYIFNSTTYHSVNPNLDNHDRNCIAFNLEIKSKPFTTLN